MSGGRRPPQDISRRNDGPQLRSLDRRQPGEWQRAERLRRDDGDRDAADGEGRSRPRRAADRPLAARRGGEVAAGAQLAPLCRGPWGLDRARLRGRRRDRRALEWRERRGLHPPHRLRRAGAAGGGREPAGDDASPPPAAARQAPQGAEAAPSRPRRRPAQDGGVGHRRRPRSDLPLTALRDRPRMDQGHTFRVAFEVLGDGGGHWVVDVDDGKVSVQPWLYQRRRAPGRDRPPLDRHLDEDPPWRDQPHHRDAERADPGRGRPTR